MFDVNHAIEEIVDVEKPSDLGMRRVHFTDNDNQVIIASDEGHLFKADIKEENSSMTFNCTQMEHEHQKGIKDLQFSADKSLFITASADMSSVLWDT